MVSKVSPTNRHLPQVVLTKTYNSGFIEDGRLREHIWKNGKFVDAIVMSVLQREWVQQTETSLERVRATVNNDVLMLIEPELACRCYFFISLFVSGSRSPVTVQQIVSSMNNSMFSTNPVSTVIRLVKFLPRVADSN